MKVKLLDLAEGLFGVPYYYLELASGEIFQGLYIPENYKTNQLFIRLPSFTQGVIRQNFLRSKENTSKDMDQILSYPTFEMRSIEEQCGVEEQYIRIAHDFCERNGIEDEYYRYAEVYKKEFAKQWCVSNGYDWSEEKSSPLLGKGYICDKIVLMWNEESWDSFCKNKYPKLNSKNWESAWEIAEAYRNRK